MSRCKYMFYSAQPVGITLSLCTIDADFWCIIFNRFYYAPFLMKFHTASCKWRDAQRAMRNRQFIGYTLGHLERSFTTCL